MKKKKMKIYGLKRTGTNFLAKLLIRNFHVECPENYNGWKHGAYVQHLLGEEVPFIVVIKHPLSWIDSLYDHIDSNWGFLRFANHYYWEWNNMYRHWDGLYKRHITNKIVRYEDLIDDTKGMVKKIAKDFDMKIVGNGDGNIYTVENRINPGRVKSCQKFEKEKYFLNQDYLEKYPVKFLKKMKNEKLDKYLMDKYNYTIDCGRGM